VRVAAARLAWLTTLALAAGCAATPVPAPAAPVPAEQPPEPEQPPDDGGAKIAVPGWVAALIDRAVEVDDRDELERLADAASDEILARMLPELEDEDRAEARLSVMTLMLIEWDSVLGEEEAFGSAEFKRQIVLATILGFERALRGKPPHEQMAALRCDLIASQLGDLRRQAFGSASELFRRRLDSRSAADLGAAIRVQLSSMEERSKELSGICPQEQGASVALANAWIDAGYLLNDDPCDVLTWDLYMVILGADEQLPEAERVLGGGCTPNVLVFH